MKKVSVMIEESGQVISEEVYIAETMWTRFRGLMGRKSIPEGYCLWIRPCNQIHMMHMNFPIDVIYLDRSNRVVEIHRNLQPWSFGKKVKEAHSVIECKAGVASVLKLDDKLSFY